MKTVINIIFLIFTSISINSHAECDKNKFSKAELVKMLDASRLKSSKFAKNKIYKNFQYEYKFKDCRFILFENPVDADEKIPIHLTKVFYIDMDGKISDSLDVSEKNEKLNKYRTEYYQKHK